MASLKGKVVLITGASSGIGAGCAVEFAAAGCRLALTGRKTENLQVTASACKEAGLAEDQIFLFTGDVTDEEVAKKFVEESADKFGQIDVLVNSAGIVVNGSVETLSLEDYDRQMNINTRVPFYMTQLCVPHLSKTKGSIVNISSITGMQSYSGVASYCMSKSAVDMLTKCSALDLAKHGIRVNAVNPGVIVTEVHKRGGMSEEQYVKFLERCKATHALGRVGSVDEVSKAVRFLASDEASFITGTLLPIDGGRLTIGAR